MSTLTPSSWTSSVEWPTQVTVASPRPSRSARPSLATMGKLAFRGANVVENTRETKNCIRVKKLAGGAPGSTLANPPIR